MAAENHKPVPKYQPGLNINDVMGAEAATGRYRRSDRCEVVDPWDNDLRLFVTMTGGTVIVARELDDGSHLVTLDYDDLNAVVSED